MRLACFIDATSIARLRYVPISAVAIDLCSTNNSIGVYCLPRQLRAWLELWI
jgi:hypothetical protein